MQKLVIIGNLGNDSKIVSSKNGGESFVSFSVACNEAYKNAEGTNVEKTTWYNCIYKRQAVAPFLKKGNKIYIEGRPEFKTYVTQDGKTYVDATIFVSSLEFLEPKKD